MMDTRSLISQLNTLDLNDIDKRNIFLRTCSTYLVDAQSWLNNISKKYDLVLTETEKYSHYSPSKKILLTSEQQLISAIATDLYYHHAIFNIHMDIAKLRKLKERYPSNKELVVVVNAAIYTAMSIQSYLHDADGGVMSINAHSKFAQNRSGWLQGQLVNNIIMPGITQIAAEFTAQESFRLFTKVNRSLAIEMKEDMLHLLFLENFQLYIVANKIESSVSDSVYDVPHQHLLDEYDALIEKENQKYCTLLAQTPSKSFETEFEIQQAIRKEETPGSKALKRKVFLLTEEPDNKYNVITVNRRKYYDNTAKLYHDLLKCLNYFNETLKREESIELKTKFKTIILLPLEKYSITLTEDTPTSGKALR